MIKKEYYKACDLSLNSIYEKRKKEFFNEYGYNLSSSRLNDASHYNSYSKTNQNNVKRKPKK